MSIETYGELKTAVENYSHRSDLTAMIPDFVKLAEADANRRMGTSFALTTRPDGATNDLLEVAPDVYLFGALTHMALYTRDEAELAKYSQLYAVAVQSAQYRLQELAGLFEETAGMEYPIADKYTYDIESDT